MPLEMAAQRNWRVLIADDDPAICTLIDTVLRKGPYEMVMCNDAESALVAVDRNTPFDIIICDFMLPGISGIELIERLRGKERTRGVPILMVSGHTNYAMDGRAKNAGANMFLNKPFTISQLRSAVTHLLSARDLTRNFAILASGLKVFIVAVSLALDVFAVSVGVGMRGISTGMKIRIGIAFASAEIIMNLIGAGLGAVAGRLIGDAAGYLGFAALIGVGCYMIYEARRDLADRTPLDLSQGWGLILASISISLDSLGIGFSILYIGVPLVISLGTIFVVSVAATTLGLALGRRLGSVIEDRAELFAGILLTLTGAAFALFKALHIG